MFGLDDMIANLSDGTTLWIVMSVAVLLGLRHATDPDHVAAVSTVVAGGEGRSRWAPARLGVAWGIPYLLIKVSVGELSPAELVLARTVIAWVRKNLLHLGLRDAVPVDVGLAGAGIEVEAQAHGSGVPPS